MIRLFITILFLLPFALWADPPPRSPIESIIKIPATKTVSPEMRSILTNCGIKEVYFDLVDSALTDNILRPKPSDLTEHDISNFLNSFYRACSDATSRQKFKAIVAPQMVAVLTIKADKVVKSMSPIALFRVPKEEIDSYKILLTSISSWKGQEPLSDKVFDLALSSMTRLGMMSQERRKRSCTPVDLRSNPVLKETRNQDTVGWCYAFTAADLISYKLGTEVSSVDAANGFSSLWTTKVAYAFGGKGGIVSMALYEMMKNGVCKESDMPIDAASSLFPDSLSKEMEDSLLANCTSCLEEEGWRQIFPNVETKDIMAVLKSAYRYNPPMLSAPGMYLMVPDPSMYYSFDFQKALSDLVRKSCENRIKIDPAYWVETMDSRDERYDSELFETLDKNLNGGNLVGISYHAGVLTKLVKDPKGEDSHASSIVGRRFDEATGQCQYLIRNSWGTGCKQYYQEKMCENGNIWLAEEYLAPALMQLTYLK